MFSEFWVVVGNGMSWGKGESFKKALSSMLKEGNGAESVYPTTQMHVYKIESPDNDLRLSDVTVDELGGVSYPLNAKVRKLVAATVPATMKRAFNLFDEEVEEYEQSETFLAAFDD